MAVTYAATTRPPAQCSVLGPLVDVTDYIDTSGSDEQPASQISLSGKAHDPTVTAPDDNSSRASEKDTRE